MQNKNDKKIESPQKSTKEAPTEYKPDWILKRFEELEQRFTQLATTLETAMEDTVSYENLAERLIGPYKKLKTRKNRRVTREWTPEEKAAFHARMVAAKKAKKKARQEAAKEGSAKK